MAAFTTVVCELLCFIQNNISSVPKFDIISRVSGYYSVNEIVDAKNEHFAVSERLKSSGLAVDLPRNVVRRAGDSKRKADTEDFGAMGSSRRR